MIRLPSRSTRTVTLLPDTTLFRSIDKYVSLLRTRALTAIVARLLRPDEIGVFVVSYGIVMLGETVRDFGASAYIVQEKDLSAHDIKTTFTVVFGVSLLIAGGLGLAAAWIGHLYSDPRLAPTIQIAAVGRSEEHTSELQSLMRNTYAV